MQPRGNAAGGAGAKQNQMKPDYKFMRIKNLIFRVALWAVVISFLILERCVLLFNSIRFKVQSAVQLLKSRITQPIKTTLLAKAELHRMRKSSATG